MDNGFALANTHRIQQVRLSAEVQRKLAAVYKRTIDPNDLDRTFPLYLAAAQRVIGQGRELSDVMARRYYMRVATAAGVDPAAIDMRPAPVDREAIETSLRVTGPVTVKSAIASGVPLDLAVQLGLAKTIAAGKRITLNAGREMLIRASRRDPNVDGWARVSDGDPCYFCAMLIGRGPDYSEKTVSFRSHDGCGCGVRLVYAQDADGGWDRNATALNRLWKGTDDPDRPEGSTLTVNEWRALYNASRKAPGTPQSSPARERAA
jgi:hypothetical protein